MWRASRAGYFSLDSIHEQEPLRGALEHVRHGAQRVCTGAADLCKRGPGCVPRLEGGIEEAIETLGHLEIRGIATLCRRRQRGERVLPERSGHVASSIRLRYTVMCRRAGPALPASTPTSRDVNFRRPRAARANNSPIAFARASLAARSSACICSRVG